MCFIQNIKNDIVTDFVFPTGNSHGNFAQFEKLCFGRCRMI